MTLDFNITSFIIGTFLGSGSIWSLLHHKISRQELHLKKIEACSDLRNKLFELMSMLKDSREYYADLRDGKVTIAGITNNVLNQLQTEIDLIYSDILASEAQLSLLEKRKPRPISKSHGGRTAPPGTPLFHKA